MSGCHSLDDILISIVVPTYNEERKKDLFELLDSIKKQTYKIIETIIVVEKSTSFYAALVEYIKDQELSVQVIFSKGLQGISYARNLGIEKSSGSIIAITDDDAILPPNWAQILLETYKRHPEAIGVTGQAVPLWIDPADSWFPQPLYWMIGCTAFRGWTTERATIVTSGVNMSFRAEAFTAIKFATSLGGGASAEGKLGFPNEDNDFAMKITGMTNKLIIYNPALLVSHKVYSNRVSIKYVRKYAYWQGCAEARYSKKWYSKRTRKSFQFKLIVQLMTDFVYTLLSSRKVGLQKGKVVVTLVSFLSLGYLSYKLGLHKYHYFVI
jgi:glucosyl-dolichyl phosphate glucuronosyltransferase